MKKYISISITALFLLTGCDYSETATTSTKVSTSDTGQLNVAHSKENTSTVNVAGETFSTTGKINIFSDGTPDGTKFDTDLSLKTPNFTEGISMFYDSAKNYTIEEGQALIDKSGVMNSELVKIAEVKIQEGTKVVADSIQNLNQ
jgi:hypothetical protein